MSILRSVAVWSSVWVLCLFGGATIAQGAQQLPSETTQDEETSDFSLDLQKLAQTIAYSLHGFIDLGYMDRTNSGYLGNPSFFMAEATFIFDVPVIMDTLYVLIQIPLEAQFGTNDGRAFSFFYGYPNGQFFVPVGEISWVVYENQSAVFRKTTLAGGIIWVPFGIEVLHHWAFQNKFISRPRSFISMDPRTSTLGTNVFPGTFVDLGLYVNQQFQGFGQIDVFAINGDPFNAGQLDMQVPDPDDDDDDDSSSESEPPLRGGLTASPSGGVTTAEGNSQKSFGTRLQVDDIVQGLNFGASLIYGHWRSNRYTYRYGFHFKAALNTLFGFSRSLLIMSEFVAGTDEAASDKVTAPETKNREVWGWYVLAAFEILRKVELIARYGQSDNDLKDSPDRIDEVSAGVLWHVLTNGMLKFEYQWVFEGGTHGKVDNDFWAFQFVVFW